MRKNELTHAALGFALLTSNVVLAQQDETLVEEAETRWYQIELLAFTQHIANQSQEQWRTDIALAYPPNWQQLKQPLNHDGQSLSTSTEATDKSDEVEQPQISPLSTGTDLEREAYYLLPENERELTANARALARDNRYRILFHESWRQPVVDLENAPALLISGGERYGDHEELEGSITISVARYLHLHTNLWLSEFTRNYGQQWHNQGFQLQQQSEKKHWPEIPIRPDLRALEQQAWSDVANQEDAWSGITQIDSEYDKILNQPYVLDRVVLVKQKRRMRSGELHFIDHPLMGLLIKITPYELPIEDEIEVETEDINDIGNN